MPYQVAFRTAAGETIYVESDEARPPQDRVKVSANASVAEASQSFEQALAAAKPGIACVAEMVRSLEASPSEVELEFGLKVSGELGLFTVAKTAAEANYTLKLKWGPAKSAGSGD